MDAVTRKEHDHRPRAPGNAGAQALAHGRQPKSAVLPLFENAHARETRQHTPQRRRVRLRGTDELVGVPRPVVQQVGDAELHGEMEGVRDVVLDARLVERRLWRKWSLRSFRGHRSL